MIYNNKEIRPFGFGMMRLPMLGDEIDIAQTKQMVDVFMQSGFTYFDTAYGYLNQKSEGAAKIALVDRYPRDAFQIATKMPAWTIARNKSEAEQMFFTSLERLGVDYIDFYLLHNLGADRVQVFEDWDLWSFVFAQKALGKIKKVGFSLHDNAEVLDSLLTKHPEVDFVQLQLNYADWDDLTVQSRKCYEVAQKHGKPVVVMEPIRGGVLANPPQKVKDIFDQSASRMSYPHWALKYAVSKKNLVAVLSGMSTLEQMQENCEFMNNIHPITADELATIEHVQAVLKTIPSIPCTSCRYCVKDCPKNIPIPEILSAMNKKLMYNDEKSAKSSYGFVTRSTPLTQKGKASDCIGCRKCEKVCPQFISIVDNLKIAAAMLEQA